MNTDTIRDLKEYAQKNYNGNLSHCITDLVEKYLNNGEKMIDPITREYMKFLQIFRPAYENILKKIKQITAENSSKETLENLKNFQKTTLELLEELKKLRLKKL